MVRAPWIRRGVGMTPDGKKTLRERIDEDARKIYGATLSEIEDYLHEILDQCEEAGIDPTGRALYDIRTELRVHEYKTGRRLGKSAL